MRLVVVLINYRTAQLTLDALRSTLRELESIPDTLVHLIDNDSGDGSYARLRDEIAREGWQERVRLIATARNGGFSYGVNAGVRPALESSDPPDYFYLLNSDAKPDRGAIATLLRFLDENARVGICGSYVYGPDGETHDTAFGFPSPIGEFTSHVYGLGLANRLLDRWVVSRPVPDRAARVDWLAGASMMIRRRVLEDAGLFDEGYFLYFEETDFCRRAAEAGWPTWYVPESRVVHLGGASTGWKDFSRPRPSFWFEGRRYYWIKNHGRVGLWAANAFWILGFALGRTKAWLQRRPYPQPERLFRDFLRHTLWKPVLHRLSPR